MEISQEIKNDVRALQKKFLAIKRMEYVKSVRKGNTGIGATFEYLLGKDEDSLQIPDFGGIEIKTKRGYSKSLINLFNAVPTGGTYYEVKRLRDKYGYPDSNDKNLKRINTAINGKEMTKVGLFYYFKLRVDKKLERLILSIYDWNKILIDESTYWDLDIIEEKVLRKLKNLALIKAWPNKIGGQEYFKYYKMDVYILKDFENFINAIEDGIIKVVFKIGNYYDEKRYGMVHSHGVGFAIAEDDLEKIYEIYK